MNHKKLIILTVAIFAAVGIAAFIIPSQLHKNAVLGDEQNLEYADIELEDTEEYEKIETSDDVEVEAPHQETMENENNETETITTVAPTPVSNPPTPAPVVVTETPSPTPTSKPVGYTLSEVAQHSTEASCWTAVNGTVYDLTPYLKKHPGGKSNIMKICGIDGTKAFERQHGGESRPENTLDGFDIGPLI